MFCIATWLNILFGLIRAWRGTNIHSVIGCDGVFLRQLVELSISVVQRGGAMGFNALYM